MTWISLDCRLPDHPKMALLPSDAARYGWIVVLLRAKEQRRPGTFTSTRHFKEVLARHAKHLPHYLSAGLLESDEDGALVVHDWKRYQWAAAKQRQREDKEETTEGQEKDSRAGNAVPVLVDISVLEDTGGVGGEEEPEFPLLQWLAQHGCYITPGNGYHRHLVTGVERHGAPAILAMFDRLSRAGVQQGDVKGYVFGALDALKPKPNLKAVDAEDSAEAERRRFNRGVERTRQRIAELQSYIEPKGDPA